MNQKGFINIALIALIVLMAGVLGYVTLIKKSAPAEQSQKNNLPIDETTNWKIYRSDKYGFEVKYPLTWSLLPGAGDGNDIHLASSSIGERGTKPGEVVIEIQAFRTKPSGIDLLSFAKSQLTSEAFGPGGELTRTNLYGLSVIKVDHAGGEGPDGPGYYIEKGPDKFFYVLVYGRTHEQIVNRIISTIKFMK